MMLNKPKDKHLYELLSGATATFILKLVGLGFGYLFLWLISLYYGASTVGIFTLSFTLLQITAIIGRFGLDTALLRFISEDIGHKKFSKAFETYKKASIVVLSFTLILTIVLYTLSPLLAEYIFKKPSLTIPFQTISLAIIPMSLINLNFETLRAFRHIKSYAFFQNVSVFFFTTLFIVFLIANHTPSIEIITVFVYAVYITCGLSFLFTLRIFQKCSYAKQCESRKTFFILRTSLPMLIAGSLMLIMGWTDTIMIGIFKNETDVGIYSIALKISSVTSIILMAVNSMAAPKFAQQYSKKNFSELQHIVSRASMLTFWATLPIVLFIVILSTPLLSIFGEEFTVAKNTLLILIFGQLINAASGSVGYLMQMTDNQKLFQYIIFLSLLINIVLNYLLIPTYSFEGAAIASAISLITWNIISIIFVYKKLNIVTFYLPFFTKYKIEVNKK